MNEIAFSKNRTFTSKYIRENDSRIVCSVVKCVNNTFVVGPPSLFTISQRMSEEGHSPDIKHTLGLQTHIHFDVVTVGI